MNTTPPAVKQTPRRATKPLGPYLSPADAAKYLGVHKTHLYAMMKRRDLPWYELAGTRGRRIRIADLDRLARRASSK